MQHRENTPFEAALAEAHALGENIVMSLSMNMAIKSLQAEEQRSINNNAGAPSYYETISLHAMWSHIAHESVADA